MNKTLFKYHLPSSTKQIQDLAETTAIVVVPTFTNIVAT